jgi:uncharacterized membrane protein YphA (DoxX/SURF4 family)
MNKKKLTVDICRVVLGLTFIFSGFVKTVDPWGTALKISEYLNVYGAGGYFDAIRFPLAIALCAAELTLGLMLVSGVKTRLSSMLALLVMSGFLVVTFLSATVLPVEDCGCFGDALHLSAWASFGKNVVLWILALAVWLDARKRLKIFPVTTREWVCTIVFAGLSVALGTYCYRHLPLIDFLPYKVGVSLRDAVYDEKDGTDSSRMVYRDLTDGSLREFAVSDTTWYDSSRWEFVEMVEVDGIEPGLTLREFAVFNSAGDATREIVDFPGNVYMLCATRLEFIEARCAERFEKVVKSAAAEGAKVVLLTASPISDGETASFGDTAPVTVYNVDATTMMTMLRARTGMVTLSGGEITDKKNCRDL